MKYLVIIIFWFLTILMLMVLEKTIMEQSGKIQKSIQENSNLQKETLKKLGNLLANKKKPESIVVDLTAYVPTGKLTATGKKTIHGVTVATSRDMKHLLGRKAKIPGVGIRTITDTTAWKTDNGKPIRKTIDVLVRSKKTAKKFGRKEDVKITLL